VRVQRALGSVAVLGWALVALSGSARAGNDLVLSPASQIVGVGEPVFIDLGLLFEQTSVGGEVQVEFDAAVLTLDSVSFGTASADDVDFRCPPDPSAATPRSCPTKPGFLSFGSFDGLSNGTVLTLLFEPMAEGMSEVKLTLVSPFSDETGQPLAVNTGQATVYVPEPRIVEILAAGWIFLAWAHRSRHRALDRGGSPVS